jgi:hypothetical protein
LFDESVEVHVTVESPTANNEPDEGVQTTSVIRSPTSAAETENLAIDPWGEVASTTTLFGRTSFGAVVSTIEIENDASALFPCLSTVLHVTTVFPKANVLPLAGEQVTGLVTSTVSVANTDQDNTAPEGDVASCLISAGILRDGAVVSCTVTSNDPVPVLPCLSVADHFTAVVPMAKTLSEGGLHTAITLLPSTIS